MRMVLERSVLEGRLADCRKAKAARLQRQATLEQAAKENFDQLNALVGRETELTELLALPEEPDGESRRD